MVVSTAVPNNESDRVVPVPERIRPLERAPPLDPASFPNPSKGAGQPLPATIANLRYLLNHYGIVPRYNVIKKKIVIVLPAHAGTPDNADNVALSHILSLAALNRMPTGHLAEFVAAIADGNPWNPVADWIESRPWDGTDRLQAMYGTLVVREGVPDAFKQRVLYRWLLSCVAAVFMVIGFACRGVLVLQGPQAIGKTRWFVALVPDALLRDEVVRLGHHLDARSKDDVITAVSHWIVEIGELDSSFRKDVAALKGFLTNDRDKVRRPYGRADSEYPRRTVFAATVNDSTFLVDTTGNTRFWTLPVIRVNYEHGIDMQQVFAQLLVDFRRGEQWWLTAHEEAGINHFNLDHRAVSAVRERVEGVVDVERRGVPGLRAVSATELLVRLGYKTPTNAQCKECHTVLRELLGEPKKINGTMRWRIPFREDDPRFDDDFQ